MYAYVHAYIIYMRVNISYYTRILAHPPVERVTALYPTYTVRDKRFRSLQVMQVNTEQSINNLNRL